MRAAPEESFVQEGIRPQRIRDIDSFARGYAASYAAATGSFDSSNPVIAEVMVMLEPISRLFVLAGCSASFWNVGTALGHNWRYQR